MKNHRLRLMANLLMFGLMFGLWACGVTQAKFPPSGQPDLPATVKLKQELAQQLLLDIGIAEQYDRYLNNSVDLAVAAPQPKFRQWLQGLLAQKAGWRYAQPTYVAQLTAHFSEAELRELIDLAQRPVMKKLLRADSQAYGNAAAQRRQLLAKVWDDYNSGRFPPPPAVVEESAK
jgi:hypothetical protein